MSIEDGPACVWEMQINIRGRRKIIWRKGNSWGDETKVWKGGKNALSFDRSLCTLEYSSDYVLLWHTPNSKLKKLETGNEKTFYLQELGLLPFVEARKDDRNLDA